MQQRYLNVNDVLPTVNVVIDGKTVMINKSDYNPDKHQLADGEAVKTDDTPPVDDAEKTTTAEADASNNTPPAVFPDSAAVVKTGKRFYVIDSAADNARVEFAGIDHENGYETDAQAWAALMAAKGAQTA